MSSGQKPSTSKKKKIPRRPTHINTDRIGKKFRNINPGYNQAIKEFIFSNVCAKDYVGGLAPVKKHTTSVKNVKHIKAVKQQIPVTKMNMFK